MCWDKKIESILQVRVFEFVAVIFSVNAHWTNKRLKFAKNNMWLVEV